jgi:F0F1-type ATP synthase assembly protein I
MQTVKSKAIAVGTIFAIDLVAILLFGVALGWL